jgi:AcrR family transcriptional regulator
VTEPVPRSLRGRRADTVRKLMDAAVAELAGAPYAEVSSRTIAKRAEVAPATFYTYFASKDHLLASVFADRMTAASAAVVVTGDDPLDRLEDALRTLVTAVFDDRNLTRAWTTAMLSLDPDIVTLRDGVAKSYAEVVSGALGDTVPPIVQMTVMLALAGAFLAAGQEIIPFSELPGVMRQATAVMIGRPG